MNKQTMDKIALSMYQVDEIIIDVVQSALEEKLTPGKVEKNLKKIEEIIKENRRILGDEPVNKKSANVIIITKRLYNKIMGGARA